MKNSRKFTSIISLLLLVVTLFTFCGCDVILDAIGLGTTISIEVEYVGGNIQQWDDLDKSKVKVTVHFVDGLRDIENSYQTQNFTLSGFDSTTLGQKTVTVTYVENEKTATATFTVNVVERVVTRAIYATYNGGDLSVGQPFDKSQISVTATCTDNSIKRITDFQVGDVDTSRAGDQIVKISHVSYDDPTIVGGQTFETTLQVKVVAVYKGLVVAYTGQPVVQGGELDETKFLVQELYNDGTRVTISYPNYTVSGFDSTTLGKQTVTIAYKGETRDVQVAVVEYPVTLSSISAEFTTLPFYTEETLTNDHFVVTATYDDYPDSHSSQVTDFTFTCDDLQQDGTFATAGSYSATISFTYNNVTKTCNVTVVVLQKIVLDSISGKFTNTNFAMGSELQTTDFVVDATLTDGTTFNVSNFTIDSNKKFDEAGTFTVQLSYQYQGVTATCSVTITVLEQETPDYGAYGILSADESSVKIINTAKIVSSDNLQIHFLELGNVAIGDCTYIKAGDTDILIDAGSIQSSAQTIGDYVDQYCTDGVLEYVIATHAHQDHIAGFVGTTSAKGIFDRYVCETIIDFPLSGQSLTTNSGGDSLYKKYLTKRNAETKSDGTSSNRYSALECYEADNSSTRFSQDVQTTGARRYIKLSKYVEMEILYNYYYENTTSDENDYSVCLLINHYSSDYDFDNPQSYANKDKVNHFLFTGDLEESGEKYLVQYNELPHCVLFKGGHHGSPTSTTSELLAEITPKVVCLCTCVGSNEYSKNLDKQFPGMEMMKRLSAYTDMLFATSLYDASLSSKFRSFNGDIVVTSSNVGILLKGSNGVQLIKDSDWFKNRYTEWSPDIALKDDAV